MAVATGHSAAAAAAASSSAAAASSVTYIHVGPSSAAPPTPGVVYLRRDAERACDNPECDSHNAGGIFVTRNHGDGDICTSCGYVQRESRGASLDHDLAHAPSHREQADARQREAGAARNMLELMNSQYGPPGGSSKSLIDPEANCAKHAQGAQTDQLNLARKVIGNQADAEVGHLNPILRDDVLATSAVNELRNRASQMVHRLRALTDQPISDVVVGAAAAVETLVGHAAAARIRALAPTAAGDDTESDDADSAPQRRPSKRARLLSPTDVIDAARHEIDAHVSSEASKSRKAYAEYKKARDENRQKATAQVTTADGQQVTLTDQDVRNAKAYRTQRALFGASAAAAAVSLSSSAAAAAAAAVSAPDSDLSEEAQQRRVADALRRNKMVQDTVHPRVDTLFEWVYVNCILSDWTSPTTRALPSNVSRDYRVHESHVSWFNRTLQYVVQYKSLLRDQSNKQMRNVELFGMHALILASWQTANPLTWGTMQSALETFLSTLNENAWQRQRDEAMRRYQSALVSVMHDPSLPLPVMPDVGSPSKAKPLGRQFGLERTLHTFATALGVKGDWAALVRRLAIWYLIQMNQRVYEQEVGEAVDKCVAVYRKHIRGLQQHDELMCQIGLLSPSSPHSSSSAAASAAAADSDCEEKSPDAKLMWQFSSAVAAAACVRKVMGPKYLKFNEDDAANCVVKTFKPNWAKKRQRPSVTKGGQPSMQIKASRFAQIAGVSERQVTACMHLF